MRDPEWIKLFARAGYGARGIVYAIVGIFAILAAFGAGDEQNTKGALGKLIEQPFGFAMMWIMIGGLVGYTGWRLIQAITDTDDHGTSPKGLAIRAGLLASAGTYSALTIYALSLLGVLPGGVSGQGGAGNMFAGFVGARQVALILAIVFLGVAVAHVYKAVRRKYEDHFEADAATMRFIHPVAITGLIARGIVLAVIALLFSYRFLSSSSAASSDTPGLKDALNFIQGLPAGGWLLAMMGAGLILFAAYSMSEAVWRRINIKDA